MRIRRFYFLRFMSVLLLLLTAVAGTEVCLMRDLWLSAGVCVAAAVGFSIWLYRLQVGQLRALQQFVYKICEGGGREDAMPALTKRSGVMGAIVRELDYLFRMEQKERRKEADQLHYYETLLDRVDTGLLVATEKGEICWMNRAAERIIGAAHLRVTAQWLDGKYTGEARVVPLREENTEEGELLLSATRFATDQGTRLFFVLKPMGPVLEERQGEAWRKLMTVLTHEIMNSLAPILSLSETLAAQPLPETPDARLMKKQHRALQTIYRRSQGLLDFTQNYRKLTRLPKPQPEDIDASEFFADLAGLFRDERLSFDQPYPDFKFRADRGQMEQVLINLIKNAREAAAPQGTDIRVTLRQRPMGGVEISVADRGPGMDPEVQKQVFVPFFTTKPGGSGIGLTLCMQIMLLHGGYIYLRSVPGRGSCFTLTLPDS